MSVSVSKNLELQQLFFGFLRLGFIFDLLAFKTTACFLLKTLGFVASSGFLTKGREWWGGMQEGRKARR